MKKRGFTLIELLAVIVVLAIIALIATPIVMNVIKKAGLGAAERSADNYVKAVETLIATEKLDGTPLVDGEYEIDGEGKLKLGDASYTVEVSGTKPVGGTVKIENGQVVKADTTIDYTDHTVTFVDGKAEASEITGSAKLCALADGTANTVGAKYTCNLGETEDTKGLVFYVLEAGTSEKDASLILEKNYDDTAQPWCATGSDSTCDANGLTDKMGEISNAWTKLNGKQIKLPTAEQIATADGQVFVNDTFGAALPLNNSWLTANNDLQYGGYWTMTGGTPNPGFVYYVTWDGKLGYVSVDSPLISIRPVITLPISEL